MAGELFGGDPAHQLKNTILHPISAVYQFSDSWVLYPLCQFAAKLHLGASSCRFHISWSVYLALLVHPRYLRKAQIR